MSEQSEQKEASEIGRNQNVIYTLPLDTRSAEKVLRPALERIDNTLAATQLLVLVPDAEAAVALAEVNLEVTGPQGIELIAVTQADRAARLIRAQPSLAVVGPPSEIRALIGKSVLKLSELRTIVLAWPDDILERAPEQMAELEAIMADIPKSAARVMVAREITPALEEVAERYLRRAPRFGGEAGQTPADAGSISIQYLTVAKEMRPTALRRVLDAVDPPSAAVVVHSVRAKADARHVLDTLGYRRETDPVKLVVGEIPPNTHAVILYEPPADSADLEKVTAASPAHTIALVEPRQLSGLMALLGDRLTPFVLGHSSDAARQRQEKLRSEIREVLEQGAPTHEMVSLEPLLERYDGIEIAAAAVRLLERSRAAQSTAREPVAQAAQRASSARPRPSGPRVFMTIGTRDGIGPGDLVGAITGEAGITSAQIGRIELRESHSLVEVDAAAADTVVERMNGLSIKGRRIAARLERDRSEREDEGRRDSAPKKSFGRSDDREDRPRKSFSRGEGKSFDRPERKSFDRPERKSFDRSERKSFGGRPERKAYDRPDRKPYDRPDRKPYGKPGKPPRGRGGDR
jgi:ATP-dependent RNA helicase DeaD